MMKQWLGLLAMVFGVCASAGAADLRLGLVGTDTSHVINFASAFNDPASPDHVAGARIIVAFKGGSPDLPSSRDRIDRFTRILQEKYGVEIVPPSRSCANVWTACC